MTVLKLARLKRCCLELEYRWLDFQFNLLMAAKKRGGVAYLLAMIYAYAWCQSQLKLAALARWWAGASTAIVERLFLALLPHLNPGQLRQLQGTVSRHRAWAAELVKKLG